MRAERLTFEKHASAKWLAFIIKCAVNEIEQVVNTQLEQHGSIRLDRYALLPIEPFTTWGKDIDFVLLLATAAYSVITQNRSQKRHFLVMNRDG